MAVIRQEANKVFETFTWVPEGDAKKIAPVLKITVYPGRTLFTIIFCSLLGSVDQYVTELRQIAANCDFESLTSDRLLRDRLVTGTRNGKIRGNLLKEKKLT